MLSNVHYGQKMAHLTLLWPVKYSWSPVAWVTSSLNRRSALPGSVRRPRGPWTEANEDTRYSLTVCGPPPWPARCGERISRPSEGVSDSLTAVRAQAISAGLAGCVDDGAG